MFVCYTLYSVLEVMFTHAHCCKVPCTVLSIHTDSQCAHTYTLTTHTHYAPQSWCVLQLAWQPPGGSQREPLPCLRVLQTKWNEHTCVQWIEGCKYIRMLKCIVSHSHHSKVAPVTVILESENATFLILKEGKQSITTSVTTHQIHNYICLPHYYRTLNKDCDE